MLVAIPFVRLMYQVVLNEHSFTKYLFKQKNKKMKKQNSVWVAVMAIVLLVSCQKEDMQQLQETAGRAAPQASMKEAGVPFKASFETVLTAIAPPPNMVQRVTGTGIASHMGASTFEAISNVTVAFPPPFAVYGTRTITAANGDKIYTSFTGTSTPVVEGKNGADLQETITGGTGRFANASGTITTAARNDFSTSSFRAEMEGTIQY